MPREEGRIIEFYTEAVEDGAASRATGRQIYREVEMCKVQIVGDRDNDWVGLANEPFMMDKKRGGYLTPAERFPDHYAVFKRNEQERLVGTPLDHLPFLSKSAIAELQFHGVKTAEQLASLGEQAITKGHGWREWRTQAGVWIADADKNALAAQAKMENDSLKERLAALEAALAAKETETPARSPGRPRKAEAA